MCHPDPPSGMKDLSPSPEDGHPSAVTPSANCPQMKRAPSPQITPLGAEEATPHDGLPWEEKGRGTIGPPENAPASELPGPSAEVVVDAPMPRLPQPCPLSSLPRALLWELLLVNFL